MRSESGNVAIDDLSSPSDFSNVLTLKGRGVIFGPDKSPPDSSIRPSLVTTDETVVLGVSFGSSVYESLPSPRCTCRGAEMRVSVVDDGPSYMLSSGATRTVILVGACT